MGKTQKNEILKNKKKIKIAKSLNLISPFYFQLHHSFIYNIKLYKNFKNFCKTFNDYKLNKNEILYLKTNINSLKESFDIINENKMNGEIIDYFKEKYAQLIQIEEIYSEETKIIKKILENRQKADNISIRQIKHILSTEYKINISISTIYRIIKNKLKYKYRKTMIKNHDLDNLKYKIISNIFIKVIIRAMKMNMDFVFIDESKFSLINNNFRTWIKKNDNIHYGPKEKKKLNMILAVSTNQVINYQLTNDNINSNKF